MIKAKELFPNISKRNAGIAYVILLTLIIVVGNIL